MEKIIVALQDMKNAQQVMDYGLKIGEVFKKPVEFIHVTDPRDVTNPSNIGDSKSTITDMTAGGIVKKEEGRNHQTLQGILNRKISSVNQVPSANIISKTGHFEELLIEEGNKKETLFLVFCCQVKNGEDSPMGTYMDVITNTMRPSLIIPPEKFPLNPDNITYITAYHEDDIEILKDIREMVKWIKGTIEVLYFLDDEDYKSRVLDNNALNMLKEEVDYEYFSAKRLWSDDMDQTFRNYLEERKPGLISFRRENKGVINRILRRKTIREWVLEQNYPVLIYNG